MLDAIIVVLEGAAGVVRRIDHHALHLPRVFLFEGLEAEEVVTAYEQIVEDISIRDPVRGMIRPLRLLQQDARLQPRPVLLADPCEFEFLLFGHAWSAEVSSRQDRVVGNLVPHNVPGGSRSWGLSEIC